jgi:tetraacyldisaccharide 4'-kinase
MLLKTPKFWSKKNIISVALLPLSFVYYLVTLFYKHSDKPLKISKPVICVGNFTAGGSGKTPIAIAIGKLLKEIYIDDSEFNFVYLSSGYKGKGVDFISLRQGDYSAGLVGDEPLLLNEIAPTFVSKNRLFAAKRIDKMGEVKAIVLDDGMQNKSLEKDLVIAVVDGKLAFGNGFLIPAGPMRQTLRKGLKIADFVIVIGKATEKTLKKLSSKKIIMSEIKPINIEKFLGQKLVAFCGLGYPQKFFSFAESQGLEIICKKSFPDHYRYQKQDLEKLYKIAKDKGAKLITTKKDWIKFPTIFKEKIDYLDIELEFLDKEFITNELKRVIR